MVGTMNFNTRISLVLSLFLSFNICAASEERNDFSISWDLGGSLNVKFQSNTHFDYTQNDEVQLSAHLPGLDAVDQEEGHSTLTISHRYAQDIVQLYQMKGMVDIVSPWSEKLPPDFIHLLYGAARVEWLKSGIFPVHAACVGNDQDGYALLMGAPGSGKTSVILNAVLKYGCKVFSGDKTLLRFNDMHQLEAIAGTHTITVRNEDVGRWKQIPKLFEQQFVDRQAFQLIPESYTAQGSVPINKIILLSLSDTMELTEQLNPKVALHMLYPFFMDKQREDILVEGDQAFFDGAVCSEIRAGLAKNLKIALEGIPVYRAVASLEKVTSMIIGNENFAENTTGPKKILFGICGISNGHCSRQLPVIKHLLEQGHEIAVFTYGDGLTYFDNKLKNFSFKIIPVANPYYVGTPSGLDFELTAQSDKNDLDFIKINSLAMHRAATEFGCPDLVISDYEMVAAQFAYAKNIPLVTLDQQSKYLVGDFLPLLNGTSYIDEVERLSLFFPKAHKRIAVSFFRVDKGLRKSDFNVDVISPMIRPEVLQAKGIPKSKKGSILVYVTAQQLGDQPIDQWIEVIRAALPKDYKAHLFLPKRLSLPQNDSQLIFYHHGDEKFDPILFSCHGIVTTAGHNLLSEAMYLEKPVFALPLPLYEQQLNAHIIEEGRFGLSRPSVNLMDLCTFFANLDTYSRNIAEDTQYLLKEPGNALIIEKIDNLLKQ